VRPIDEAASRFPKLANALEKIRGAGVATGRGAASGAIKVVMKVGEFLDFISAKLFGPPPAYAYAGNRPLSSLPRDMDITVSLQPVRSLTQPMQMTSLGDKPAGGPEPETATTGASTPLAEVQQVEVVDAETESLVDAKAMAPDEWLSSLKARLSPEELSQYEVMRGKGDSRICEIPWDP